MTATTTKTTKKKAAPKSGERLKKEARAEIAERIAALDGAKAPKGTKAAKTPKAPKGAKAPKTAKPRRTSALDAAAQVLASAKDPMSAGALIDAMAKRDLWKSPGGKTPSATLYAALIREIKAKGKDARFRKMDRGLFTVNGKAG